MESEEVEVVASVWRVGEVAVETASVVGSLLLPPPDEDEATRTSECEAETEAAAEWAAEVKREGTGSAGGGGWKAAVVPPSMMRRNCW